MIDTTSDIVIFDTKLKAERDYWLKRVASVTTTSGLLPDYQRNGSELKEKAIVEIVVPRELSLKVCALVGGSPFLLYTTLMAALKVCLYKYTNHNLITVGSPPLQELGKSNTLAILDRLDSEMLFQELLMKVRESLLEAYAHQHYPFSRLLRDLQFESNGSCPLFEVALELTNLHGGFADTRHDITLTFTKTGDDITGRLEFKPELYKQENIERLSNYFLNVLRTGVEEKKKRLREFELITESEREQLLHGWNQTQKDYPSEERLHTLFEQQVKKSPADTALKFAGDVLTYRELNTKANQLARHLRTLGVGPEVLVGLHLERSFDLVIGILAVLKAGGAYVPLDLIYPKERLSFMLEDAGLKVLLTQQRLVTNLPEHDAKIVLLDSWESFSSESGEDLAANGSSDNLAYVLYTSGSTGRPKGVMITHRGLINYLTWATEAYRVSEGQGAPLHSPVGFDLTVTSLFTPLLAGKCVVLLREDEGAEALLTSLRDEDFSLVKLTPAHLEVLKQLPSASEAAQQARTFIVGGEALHSETISFWREHRPEVRIINEYGPTETVVGCCVYEVPFGNVTEGAVPIGLPIDNTQLYILDAHMKPVPLGIAGELYIGGVGLARGYLNRPELTAERFEPDPFGGEAGARLYRTGDLVRAHTVETLEFVGRRDRQVKVRGYRIELGEVEATLLRLPEVREAVVTLDANGQAEANLVAYVVGAENTSDEQIRASLQTQLPAYMVPSRVVLLERLPLTTHGKVDQQELRALAAAAQRNAGYGGAPQTEVEQKVAEIWGAVLGIKGVGREANFFDLGGHSLLATQVMARVREVLHVEIPLHKIFESPTVAEFAGQIEAARQTSELPDSIKQVAHDGQLPLSFAQQRLWYLDRLHPENPAYNCCTVLRVTGPLNVPALEQAINEIIHRHETLRTIFPEVEGWPGQVVLPEQPVTFLVTDLSALPKTKAEAIQQQLARADVDRSFDLSRGPVIRASVSRMDAEEHLVQLTMHHIVSDGWSLGILCREISALYEAFAAGNPTPLPDLTVQYGDFAVWQREHLQGDRLDQQLSYWKQQLAGAPPVLELPSDRPRPEIATFRGAKFHFGLSQELSESLYTLSRHEGVTLFMLLLAAFDVLLYRYTDQPDIVVGTAIANRNRAETEPLIGFFVNMLVLRTDMSGNPSFRELLERVKQMTLAAYQHQDVPFEQIMELLQPQRSLNRSPVYQVEFTLQNAPSKRLETQGLSFEALDAEPDSTDTDFNFIMLESGNGLLLGYVIYSSDLFDAVTIERMTNHFQTLLQGIVEDPDRRILELDLTTSREAQALLTQWDSAQAALH
jgi:amino acid adenylation domain-containing protein